MTGLEPIMGKNFIEYASYVIVDRAIPEVRDGLKPVQRRILTTLERMEDGKFHKVANVIGETMKLHPHGDASIGDALVTLATKGYFIETQGNFGNPVTGHAAAAPRYIECRLTPLAREALFKRALTEFRPSYDGRTDEPVCLPAKLPVVLMLGTEGIAVGMSTRILPHNFVELLEAQIAVLRGEKVSLLPDFPTGGIMDVTDYADGAGKVKVRARIERADAKTIVIREIPYSTTTESLIASVEAAAQRGKVKIASIDDFTTDRVEIQIGLPRGVRADEVIPQLFAYTDCEVSISSNIVVIRERRPVEMTVGEVLTFLTEQLREQIRAELELELGELADRRHWLSLERIFIENRLYNRIEDAGTEEAVYAAVHEGLAPFADQLERFVTDDDVTRLLAIPIRRISRWDLERNLRDIAAVEAARKAAAKKLRALTKTAIAYLEGLLERHRAHYPRRTEIATFDAVDVRAVAVADIKLAYDPRTGFFGSEVKGDRHQLTVSEYDRILVVTQDGVFRVIGPEAKVLIPGRVLYLDRFDPEQGQVFTVVYRDGDRIAYAKKVHVKSHVRDREYELVKGRSGRVDLLLPGDADDLVHLDFVPARRQRVHEATFDLATLELTGVTARGRRLAAKPVARVKRIRRTADATPDEAEEPAPPSRPAGSAVAGGDADEDGQYSLFGDTGEGD